MKVGKLFRKAARLIDSGQSAYSCLALDAAGAGVIMVDYYSSLIAPGGFHHVVITDFERDDDGKPVDSKTSREHRVMALLMVGEVWNGL